jgi:hypothetical protein
LRTWFGGLAFAAGLFQIHSQRCAWASAACNTPWTLRTVPAERPWRRSSA